MGYNLRTNQRDDSLHKPGDTVKGIVLAEKTVLDGRDSYSNPLSSVISDALKIKKNYAPAPDFICLESTYYMNYLVAQNVADLGMFFHVSLKKDLATFTRLGTDMGSYIGPTGDIDGDGIPNKEDPQPTIPNPS